MTRKKISNFKPYSSIVISSLKGMDDILEKILSTDYAFKPRKIDKPLILYGAGNLGKMAKDFFDYFNIPFLYVVDKNPASYKNDEFWKNIKIVHPDEAKKNDKKNCLLVACVITTPLMSLLNELKENDWEDIAFFYDLSNIFCKQHPLNNGWCVNKLNEKEKKSIRKVFSLLTDDTSRAHYLQFLAWRKLRVELSFASLEINNSNRFFIPEIISALQQDEIFVDCGAHHGSVTEKFLKIVNNKYKKIYVIEPDKKNFKILKNNLNTTHNLITIKKALSNKNGEENFSQGFNFASKLNKNGEDLIKTITLDSLKIKATFIKMHLEGGDLKALIGSINTIKKYRPIVAVTIYHNADGVWKTPYFLMDNTKNYNYYLRVHSWGGTGTVFYAIPKND